jgi:hypothetical protein
LWQGSYVLFLWFIGTSGLICEHVLVVRHRVHIVARHTDVDLWRRPRRDRRWDRGIRRDITEDNQGNEEGETTNAAVLGFLRCLLFDPFIGLQRTTQGIGVPDLLDEVAQLFGGQSLRGGRARNQQKITKVTKKETPPKPVFLVSFVAFCSILSLAYNGQRKGSACQTFWMRSRNFLEGSRFGEDEQEINRR